MRKWFRQIPFFIKLFNWEYWPTSVVYMPLSLYYVYLAIKARSFLFFTASNPSIETGGMIFESKWKIFQLIPPEYYPKTFFVEESLTSAQKMTFIQGLGLPFPFILKPDRGERGWAVKKIENREQLVEYIESTPVDFLVQEYVDFPIELSVFYYRYPHESKGKVSSVTFKEHLSVIGNGVDSLYNLIMQQPRALIQLDALRALYGGRFPEIIPEGHKIVLVPYGNHCRGAMFLDYHHIIDESLHDVFDVLSKRIDGFYYGRYDIKCKSIEELKQGINFSVVELNGAGAEPAHIYQPNYSFWKAQKAIFAHYNTLCEISIANARLGIPYLNLRDFRATLAARKIYKSRVNL